MITHPLDKMHKMLKDNIASIESSLGSGCCSSWEQYHRNVGKIEALKILEAHVYNEKHSDKWR